MRLELQDLAERLVNIFVGVVEGFLGFRFLLKLFGANPSNGFVSWIYEMSDALLAPFRGVFPAEVFESQYVLEFSTLFAMIVYAVLGLLLLALIRVTTEPARTRR